MKSKTKKYARSESKESYENLSVFAKDTQTIELQALKAKFEEREKLYREKDIEHATTKKENLVLSQKVSVLDSNLSN